MTGPDQHCLTNTHVTRGQLGNRTADLVEYVVVGVYDDHLCVALSAVPMPTLYAIMPCIFCVINDFINCHLVCEFTQVK